MPYENDMNTLASVAGTSAAAQQMGMQDYLQNQKQQLENERYAGQNPAEIAKPGLQNLFTQAQTGSEQGIAAQQQAKGAEEQALLPSEIKTGQAELGTKYNAAQVQQFGQMGQISGQIAGMMDNIPEAARPAAMNQIAQQYGIAPEKLGPLMSGDPDQLRQFSQKMIQASQSWQEKQLESTTKENVAQTEATGHIIGAEASAGARRYAADQQVKIKELNQNIDQTIASLGRKIDAAGTNADPNDIQLMHVLQQQQITARQLGAANTAQLVGQGGLAQAPTFNPTAAPTGTPSTPTAPTGGTTPPAQAGGGNALEAEMRKRGLLK